MKDKFWYTCPKCGSKCSNGLCDGCGNNNLPDCSFANMQDFQLMEIFIINEKKPKDNDYT